MKQQKNIKYQKSNIKNIAQRLKVFNVLFVFLIFIFLFINIIYSQIVPPLYFNFINNDRSSTISFLQKIKNLPEYQNILKMNDNIYGNTVKEEIFWNENKKKVIINNLEQQLAISPKARDILYSLYKLYLAEGDTVKAREYLREAKLVDPSVN
jgi:tetratricopeptide (TPR) repeat protein